MGVRARPRRSFARCHRRLGALDVLFDHDIDRTADHYQMLDIVATHQHQPALVVDDCRIGHGKAWRPASRGLEGPCAGDLSKEPEGSDEDGGQPEKDPDQGEGRVLPAE